MQESCLTIPPPNQRVHYGYLPGGIVPIKTGSERNTVNERWIQAVIPTTIGPLPHALPEYHGVMDLGQITGGLYSKDRRDLGGKVGKPAIIPLGRRNPLEGVGVGTGRGIPAIREPGRKTLIPIFTPTIGNGPAPIAAKLPVIKAGLPKLPPQILNPPIITPPKSKGVLDVIIDLIKPNITTKVQPVALDLGNLLTIGVGAYRDIQVARAQPVYDLQGLNPYSNVPFLQLDPAVVPPGATTATSANCLPTGYKFDKCGNVIKTRRRRRRRLATSSDIKDLAALSSVTTGGEKKTWIATHPS